jgi:hypothetical protein
MMYEYILQLKKGSVFSYLILMDTSIEDHLISYEKITPIMATKFLCNVLLK